jgi:hypothetical protein
MCAINIAVMRGLFFMAAMLIAQLAGQESAPLKPPFGPENPLVSPDGAYALFGENNMLWLRDQHTGTRRIVMMATLQTLTLACARQRRIRSERSYVQRRRDRLYLRRRRHSTGWICAAG